MTRKGYQPSQGNYSLLPADEEIEDVQCGGGVDDLRGAYSPMDYGDNSREVCDYRVDLSGRSDYFPGNEGLRPYGLVSVEESPLYCQPRDALLPRRHHSNDSASLLYGGGDPAYSHQGMRGTYPKVSPNRTFPDQDLYDSAVHYRQSRSSTSSTQDHQYSTVPEPNNNMSAGHTTYSPYKNYGYNDHSMGRMSAGSSSSRRSHSNNNSNYAKPGFAYQPPEMSDLGVARGSAGSSNDRNNSKMSLGREAWTNHLEDNVFLDGESSIQRIRECGNYQGHHSYNSRAQVYPESTSPLAGYESGQVSLV